MLYSTARAVLRFIFHLMGLKAEGLENLPLSGAVIIASNHVSNWDPVVVAVALSRPIHYMAKASLFKYKIADRLFTSVNAFPVRRGIPDRKAIRRALQVLEDGNVLGIFPEGARNTTGDMKAQAGVAMIALKSGAPIVPVACLGTGHILPCGWFAPLVVRVGEPIYLDEYQGQRVGSAGMEKISGDIMIKINCLLSK